MSGIYDSGNRWGGMLVMGILHWMKDCGEFTRIRLLPASPPGS